MSKLFSIIIFLICVYKCENVKSQSVQNISIDIKSTSIIITYDLLIRSDVALQISNNGQKFVDVYATGDVGFQVSRGPSKKIIYTPSKSTSVSEEIFECINCIFRIISKRIDLDTFIDIRDQQVYEIFKIEGKSWMAQNLNYSTSGGSIQALAPIYKQEANNIALSHQNERFYTWEAALKGCPQGWHLPSTVDFDRLIDALGGESFAGTKMKSSYGWTNNGSGTNQSRFNALPVGFILEGTSNVMQSGSYTSWWSKKETTDNVATSYYINAEFPSVLSNILSNKLGYRSVRCVKD